MVRCFSCLLTLVIVTCGLVPPAWATGPLGPEIRFFSRSGQDPVDDLVFFRGQLGILRPTFTDNRLYAAYRIMLGGRFSEAQARQLLARCCDAPETLSDAETSWNDLRKRVAGVPPAQDPRYGGYRRRPENMQLFDVSCFPNAYRNSAATLRARIAEHGANSRLVRDWVIGQDAVLLNCYEDSPLPEELPRNAPAWLKADLAYQIAAAYFYRLDYARAGQLFAEIGRDASSPWQKTARYLVARCAVHAAIEDKTPKLIADAQQAIDALATEPQLADYRAEGCSPSQPVRRHGRGSWNARCSLPSCRPHFHSSCATFCCWSGPARATRISARGFTTSTFSPPLVASRTWPRPRRMR
jgi:hypothetical protein